MDLRKSPVHTLKTKSGSFEQKLRGPEYPECGLEGGKWAQNPRLGGEG